MRNVYVLGTGMIKFGRYPEKTVPELGGAAALLALKDAGVAIKDVEMFACGNLYQSNAMVGQRILQQIGQTGIPVINVANACATGSTAFREAYMSVAAGMYDVSMAVGVEHMRKYGTKPEHFAKISVKSHKHATKNPFSQYRNEVSLEDVMNARMVAFPNTLYMCCPTGDGAAAAILVSEDKLKQLAGGRKRAKIAASVLTSDPWTDRTATLPDVSTLTRRASKQAYEKAGIGPKDIALTELHDCFATAELVHYENLGLCGDGEAGKFIDSGGGMHPGLGGHDPVNVSGGLLSKGHPLGATGVANICEVVWHLTQDDRAKDRQVPNAKAGQAHVIGLGSACTIHILTI